VRKAERARFLSEGEESEALIRVAFDSLGQKQRVFDPYSLSLSSMVAAAIPQTYALAISYNGYGNASYMCRQVKFEKKKVKIIATQKEIDIPGRRK